MLSDLDKKEYDVVLLQTSSPKMQMYVQDKLKLKLHSNQDTMMEVNATKDLKQVREIQGLLPPFSERWYVVVKLGKNLSYRDLVSTIKASTTCLFLITTEKYVDYKKLKEDLKKDVSVVDLYLTYMKRYDMLYIYQALVPENKRMQKKLFDYLCQSYSSDIEAVMNLFIKLNEGVVVKTRTDIANICGIGGLSVESFLFSMLKPAPTTVRGLQTVMKNRIQAGRELGAIHTVPTFYSFLHKAISSIVQIKMLRDSGMIYKSIRNLPDNFDQHSLMRYQKYFWSLMEIPMSRILRLETAMGKKRWQNELDIERFIYEYYRLSAMAETVNLKEVRKSIGG